MKKTWKKRVYDFSNWSIMHKISVILAVVGIACMVLAFFLPEKIAETWSTVLMYSFYSFEALALLLNVFCCAVIEYNKETFWYNKFRNILFASEEIVYLPVLVAIANILAALLNLSIYDDLIIMIPLGALLCFGSMEISIMISNRVKEKIVYVEPENNDVKIR